MDDGIKQLLDSEDMTNLKLAIVISGDIEGVANYIIEKCCINTLDRNKKNEFSLLDGSENNDHEVEYRLYDKMTSATDWEALTDWVNEVKPQLIDHLNKIANE